MCSFTAPSFALQVQYGSRNPAKSLQLAHTLKVQPEASGAAIADAGECERGGSRRRLLLHTSCCNQELARPL